MTFCSPVVAAVVAVALGRILYGQIGGYPARFEDLTKEAETIVIAEAERTVETARTMHPELQPGFPVIQWTSSFKVLAVFKGTERVGVTVRLKHFSPDRSRIQGGLINSGGVITLTNGADYLLFLTHRNGELYEPVSGQTFPEFSVKAVASNGPF